MRKKLFIVLPDEERADYCVGFLMGCGLESADLKVIGNRVPSRPSISQASVFEKTQLITGLLNGLLAGALIGLCAAIVVLAFPPAQLDLGASWLLALSILAGALVGAAFAAFVAGGTPREFYAPFRFHLRRGAFILLVSVPSSQVGVVQDLLLRVCPECYCALVDK